MKQEVGLTVMGQLSVDVEKARVETMVMEVLTLGKKFSYSNYCLSNLYKILRNLFLF